MLTLVLHVPTLWAVAMILVFTPFLAYSMALVGRWDMKGGMKPIASLLHYESDPYLREEARLLLAIAERLDLPEAEGFRRKMEHWNLI